MKKSEWLDCQRNEFFPKQKGIPSLVKIEHKNTATLDSARSKKKSKVAVLQLLPTNSLGHMEMGPRLKVSSDRLLKPGIKTATPGIYKASGLSTTPRQLLIFLSMTSPFILGS